MPSNVGRIFTSVFFISVVTAAGAAQTPQVSQSPTANAVKTTSASAEPIAKAPTAAEVMRDRIAKAKAFIAVRNYYAAINELENIRRETSEQSVQSVANVLLMNSYLEQGDHKKAQALLNQFYAEQKTTKPNALTNYSIVAGQIVKSARNQAERYRSLGLSINDRNLPLEALNDLEKMRETVEMVITQSKEISADKAKTATAWGLMEEATNSRVMIARDDYDARRWRDAVADSREAMANSRSVIINAVDGTTETAAPPVQQQTASVPNANTSAAIIPASNPVENKPAPVTMQPTPETKPKPSETLVASNNPPTVEQPKKSDEKPVFQQPQQPERSRVIAGAPQADDDANKVKATSSSKPVGLLEVGSLLPYAAKQSAPLYPPAARTVRASGIVKVEVTVDENGDVVEVAKATGPPLLQGSAKDAIRKWKFRPFVVDGQPVRATGFVNFNFSL